MADPISIATGAMAVAEICFKIVSAVRKLRQEMSSIDQELEHLVNDVEALRNVCYLIQNTFDSSSVEIGKIHSRSLQSPQSPESPKSFTSDSTLGSGTAASTDGLWEHIEKNINNCHAAVTKLELIVQDICRGHDHQGSSLRVAYTKVTRKKSREDELRQYRSQLDMYQHGLHLILTIIILNDTRGSHDQNARSFEDLTSDLQRLDRNIQSQISDIETFPGRHQYNDAALAALCELQASIGSAAESINKTRENKHFDIPQSVSSIFTGRKSLLVELKKIIIPSPGNARKQQRRFVVLGLGGSGKTQFCCKFAEDNQDSFWGVFWIDASTEERIQHTLGVIAKDYAGREKSDKAALHWLSNLERTWLLIIDNADDPGIQLDKYFPKGNSGNILITTRNPAHKLYGNVGPGHFDFGPLGFREATSLLLKASAQPMPWESSVEDLASHIAEKLGYLALALIHAGAVIRDKLCHLRDYPEYYNRSWKRIRSTNTKKRYTDNEDIIHTTWEICYKRLKAKNEDSANDAIQLLKTFAFFHRDNISPEILTRAMRNASLESEQKEKDARENPSSLLRSQSSLVWGKRIYSAIMALTLFILKDRSPEILPNVIREGRLNGCFEDSLDRIRIAMKELAQMSLIKYNEHNDTYHMHPVVHNWARERFSLADQSLWADVSGRVLAASILLPPLGITSEDERFHVSLLPHIDHVQGRRSSIAASLPKKPGGTVHSLLPLFPTTHQNRIHMLAKFSLVYAKCGRYENAAVLLGDVKDFLERHLGDEDKRSRLAALSLSEIYFILGRSPDAQKLQRKVLETCIRSLGPDHADTLRAMAKLGHTLWQQGHFTEARSMQEQAVRGLIDQFGYDHPDTLDTMDNLGRTVAKFWRQNDMEEAHKLHKRAVEGMEKIHGSEHERTLFAKENLCRIAVHLGGRAQKAAPEMMSEVLATRKALLGCEHPFTLLAMVNLAITQSSCGRHGEAERLLRGGITVAARDLGENHIGTLFGQHTLACVLGEQQRYDEAVDILVDVAAKQKEMASKRGNYHPDRLGTLIELARCYYLRGEVNHSLEVTREAVVGFKAIADLDHPLAEAMVIACSTMESVIGKEERHRPHISFPSVLFRAESS